MKASLKLREDHRHHHHNPNDHHQNPLLRLKVPISILGLPFISSFTAGDPTDLSFNLHSNFFTGPSLKLSYSPATTTTIPNHNPNPISLSLKSGVGLFGSPNNSPLIISAHFNLFGTHNPSFSIQIKPQFGDFSLSKTAVSSFLPAPSPNSNADLPKENGGGFPYNGVVMRNIHNREDGLLSGVAVKAKTVFPLVKFAAVKFRWGVNFPADSGEKLKLPYLTVDKISIERVEEEAGVVKVPSKSGLDGINGKVGDLEVLKGMCFLMRKEVQGLQRENNVIKESLEDMKLRSSKRNHSESNNVGKKVVSLTPALESSSGFENWRNKKNVVEENGRRDSKKFGGSERTASDVGEELKRAIEAASSTGV